MRWYQRFFRRELTERHLDAELQFHLEQQIADYVSAGMKPDEARRRARLEFGGLDQVKEECRDVGAARHVAQAEGRVLAGEGADDGEALGESAHDLAARR